MSIESKYVQYRGLEHETLQERRFNSFTRLLELDDVCVAACIYKGEVAITSNNSSIGDNTEAMINVLKLIHPENIDDQTDEFITLARFYFNATERYAGVSSIPEEAFNNIVKALIKNDPLNNHTQKNPSTNVVWKPQVEKWYEDAKTAYNTLNAEQQKAIARSAARLVVDYRKFKDFLESDKGELVTLIKNNKINLDVKNPDGLHAEMRLVDHILQQEAINPTKPEKLYLAISKECCKNCNAALEALKEHLEEGNNLQVGGKQLSSSDLPKFEIWGAHNRKQKKGNWITPQFLEDNPEVKQRYDDLMEEKLKSKVQRGAASPSPPRAELEDAISSIPSQDTTWMKNYMKNAERELDEYIKNTTSFIEKLFAEDSTRSATSVDSKEVKEALSPPISQSSASRITGNSNDDQITFHNSNLMDTSSNATHRRANSDQSQRSRSKVLRPRLSVPSISPPRRTPSNGPSGSHNNGSSIGGLE